MAKTQKQYPNPYTDDELPFFTSANYHGITVARMADGSYAATYNGFGYGYAPTLADMRRKLDTEVIPLIRA